MAEPNGVTADTETAPNPQQSTNNETSASQPPNTQGETKPPDNTNGNMEAPESRKPRDARIIHLILSSLGVTSYQERVPLMLMDFAYRYTSSVLQDALLFSDAINGTANTGGTNPPATITIQDLRMSVASRINHQFNTSLPKEFLLEIAQERNKVALPTVGKEFGVRLPPEKYCLTGINWDLSETREEWMDESDGEPEPELPHPRFTGGGMVDEPGEGMELDDVFGGSGQDGDAGDSLMADA